MFHSFIKLLISNILQLYTKAFEAVTSTTSLELQRTILANRAQAYICYGNIYTALRDIDMALSSRYTNTESATALTIKCRFRRAKLLYRFAKYNEALSEYEELIKLGTESTLGTRAEDRDLKLAIDEGLKAPQGSDRRRKDELMRAVDVCPIEIFTLFHSPYRFFSLEES
jgi:tetratricopeptide (TPR) repeat protein